MFPRATTARRQIRGCLLHETIRSVRDGAVAEPRVFLWTLNWFCPWSCLLTSAASFLIQSEGWTLPWCPAFTFPLKSSSVCAPYELHSGSITSSSPADSSLRAPLHLCQTCFFSPPQLEFGLVKHLRLLLLHHLRSREDHILPQSWARWLFYSLQYRAEPMWVTFIAPNQQLTIVAS